MSQESWTKFLKNYKLHEAIAFCKAYDEDALWVYRQLCKRHPELKTDGLDRIVFKLWRDAWWIEILTLNDEESITEIAFDSIWYPQWQHSQEYDAAFGSIERESQRRFATVLELEKQLNLTTPYDTQKSTL
jgi:hypothetical protein